MKRPIKIVLFGIAAFLLLTAQECTPPTTTTTTTTTTPVAPPDAPDILVVKLDDAPIDTPPHFMPETYSMVQGDHWYRLTQAVTPAALCGPERMSTYTGQTVDHHGYTCHVSGAMCPSWQANKSKILTVSLSDAGYFNGWYGKELNSAYQCPGDLKKDGFPNPPGIHDARIMGPGDDKTLYNSYSLVENSVKHDYKVADNPANYGTYKTADLLEQCIQQCPSNQPLALFWNPMAPHQPGTPAPDFDKTKVLKGMPLYQPAQNEGCPKATDLDITDKPYLLQTYATCKAGKGTKRTRFQDSLQAVDNRLSGLISTFLARDTGRPKRIIITSDHGQELGNHRHDGKEVPYEMTVRVPLFIYDDSGDGGDVDKLVNILDLNATIHDWAGSTPLLTNDGKSLVPLYRDGSSNWPDHTYISHLQIQNGISDVSPWHAVRQDCSVATDQDGDGDTDCFKLVKYPSNNGIGLQYELYDLSEDPWELTNLLPNTVTGYNGQPGWNLESPAVSPLIESLNDHITNGR